MKSSKGKGLHMVTFLLIIIGALNWGLVGFFQFDLVATIFGGADSVAARIIYALVGISAVVEFATHKKTCKGCCGKNCCEGGTCDAHSSEAPSQDSQM